MVQRRLGIAQTTHLHWKSLALLCWVWPTLSHLDLLIHLYSHQVLIINIISLKQITINCYCCTSLVDVYFQSSSRSLLSAEMKLNPLLELGMIKLKFSTWKFINNTCLTIETIPWSCSLLSLPWQTLSLIGPLVDAHRLDEHFERREENYFDKLPRNLWIIWVHAMTWYWSFFI